MPARTAPAKASPAADEGHAPAPGTLFEQVRSDILAGEFGATALLQEVPLAERYKVSRTPVREALARLEHEGLVEKAGRGYRVRSGTPEDVLEVYEARIVLEGQAAAGAAERRGELDLARLDHLHAAVLAAHTELAAHEPAGQEAADAERSTHSAWHATIWRASHNRTIETLLQRLTAQLRIYDRGTRETAPDLEQTRDEHERILAAIRDRRPEDARAAMIEHLTRAREVRLHRFGSETR
ncbi:GntR family transcriptional regulator [Kineosporia sp. NBRC 101677]|uniref:GntR family transcriptional regulator n=1 Tax=Kineosporia sp. NBRC 101677 TaxID=3032197 RepID=UPI0024A4B6F4|nr:GntR family transcriptional regulator [Kineosporia sp. NBRC 101677]GLY16967.1 GntR family transcriptional regulator [Kineosporia sp. NBRC 101677]